MEVKTWKKTVLLTLYPKVSKIGGITEKKGKKHTYEIKFENGESGTYYNMYLPNWVEKGAEVTYQLEKSELSDGDNQFIVNNVTSMTQGKIVNSSTPLKIFRGIENRDILFADIETVRIEKTLTKGPLFDSWKYKHRDEGFTTDKQYKDLFLEKAPLYAEFGKIVCISFGYIDANRSLVTMSLFGEDEKKILEDFITVLNKFTKKSSRKICGFAIKQFDLPYIMRRLIINNLPVPDSIDFSDSKPWELTHILDLKEIWKSNSWYTASLINLTTSLDLPSPKGVMDGSEVSTYYYAGKLNEIAEYCEQDVEATCNIYLKLSLQEVVDKVVSKTFEDGNKENK